MDFYSSFFADTYLLQHKLFGWIFAQSSYFVLAPHLHETG